MVDYNPANPARAKQPKPFVHNHGVGHQTPAHRTLLGLALGGVKSVLGGKKKRRKSAKISTGTRKKRRSSRAHSAKGAHLVAGSSAAKSHMAKLRKMRKKKAA